MKGDKSTIDKIYRLSTSLNDAEDINRLIDIVGDARYVLLGEASHGTSEYYIWRTHITKKLIEEKGFTFVAVEGDWPECYRVNRYVKNYDNSGASAKEVLSKFERWPTWMWANWEIVDLVEWIKEQNNNTQLKNKIGFYGLDVYSLWQSLEEVIGYLKQRDPQAADIAARAYQCFELYGLDIDRYALSTALATSSCETEVVNLLQEVRKKSPDYRDDPENLFNLEQNALIARNAEIYYRTMVLGGTESWNLRDTHMTDTLQRLMTFYGEDAKCIVWAHNTHVGDARATDMVEEGMVNIGQLVREQSHEEGVVLVGFSSFEGTVIAADDWGDQIKKMILPPAMIGSWEDVYQQIHAADLLTIFKNAHNGLDVTKGQRAVGVVYNPLDERGNYVPTRLSDRYDALIFINRTHALHPMHPVVKSEEIPETYPSAV